MYKFLKSGLDLTIFSALSFIKGNQALQQFLTAIAGAIGIAFTNYLLIPFIKKIFSLFKSKIKNNDKIPDELEDTIIDGIDKIEDEINKKIEDKINKQNESKK